MTRDEMQAHLIVHGWKPVAFFGIGHAVHRYLYHNLDGEVLLYPTALEVGAIEWGSLTLGQLRAFCKAVDDELYLQPVNMEDQIRHSYRDALKQLIVYGNASVFTQYDEARKLQVLRFRPYSLGSQDPLVPPPSAEFEIGTTESIRFAESPVVPKVPFWKKIRGWTGGGGT